MSRYCTKNAGQECGTVTGRVGKSRSHALRGNEGPDILAAISMSRRVLRSGMSASGLHACVPHEAGDSPSGNGPCGVVHPSEPAFPRRREPVTSFFDRRERRCGASRD